MAIGSITPSAISDAKQSEVAQQAQTSVLKRQISEQGKVALSLVESTNKPAPPSTPGVGKNLDLKA
jgi:hypothetical protein